ncbi:hypothetical protein [Chryseobacterium foetidum]|uniref:hypothetical protein n=1 Tax=Chryseobacterium foetidum TaxID=2951057 RepID=UPI0021C81EDD|nr:hypothetical protein [Chryseobacterium foetidum]
MNFSFSDYFKDYDVKDGFKKEFISLWTGWLGKENYHILDDILEKDWIKFNHLIINISKHYEILVADLDKSKLIKIDYIEKTLSSYKEYLNKPCTQFSIYVIPELICVLEEHWDYTYILWYKNYEIVEKLSFIIEESGLFHFK